MTDIISTERKDTVEGFKKEALIYCGPMRTYVCLEFCLNGGPMRAEGQCEYYIGLKEEMGKPVLVHAIPTTQPIIDAVMKE